MAEPALPEPQHSAALLEGFLGSATLAFAFFDPDLRLRRANPRLAELAGHAELLGRPVAEAFPDCAAALEAPLRRALRQGEPVEGLEIVTPRGWWLVSCFPVSGPGGERLGVGLAAQNICAQKQVEEALRKSEERFQLAEASSRGFLYEWRLPENTVWRSRGFAVTLGHLPEEVPQDPQWWAAQIHPDDAACARQAMEEALRQGGEYSTEYRVRHREGRYVHLWDRGRVLYDTQGRPARVLGTATDISERKRLEAELEQASRHVRDVINSLVAFVGVTTPSGVLIEINRAALETAGLEAGEVLGQRLEDTFWWGHSPEVRAQLFDGLRRARQGEVVRFDLPTRTKDGGITLDFIISPLKDAEGRVAYLVTSGIDISARKAAEAAQERLIELLQQSEREALALAQIANSLSLSDPMQTNLDSLAAQIAEVTGALACTVELMREDLSITSMGSFGLPEALLAGFTAVQAAGERLPSQRTAQRREMDVARRFRDNALSDPRYAPLHEALRAVRWNTVAAAPLVQGQRVLGAVVAYYAEDDEPAISDLLQLSTITSQVSLVVENMRLFQEVRGKAALEERTRLARDLHDSVSQAIYGINLGVHSARAALPHNPADALRSLDYVLHMAETATAEMKNLIFELRPESLEREGLVAALHKQTRALRLRHNLEFDLELPREPELPLPAKEALYRIAQEALNNVIKHAQARRVSLALEPREGRWRLRVRDDGKGFDPHREFPGHLGLHSMRERALSVGAEFVLHSAPGEGTCVEVWLGVGGG
ncbi:PAS domain-containing protein [Calidithermus chliarophilus]|uniref:PAS domain-containing protein n=1 Tax=Calidithermus chliarophilus TaxID=52023 RepID=UPI0003FA677E|nr:PAS domain-containing protein [Calidithermus chliarophilus]